MSSTSPPYDEYEYYEGEYAHGGHIQPWVIAGIAITFVMSFYLALIVATRLDQVVFPGNELPLGGVGQVVPGVADPHGDEPATPEERINVLVLGTDRRIDDDPDQPFRTDSIMVLTIDPFTKTAGAFSIPRDTRVEIPDGDGGVWMETRINEAYEMGEYGVNGYPNAGKGRGARVAMDTVEWNFDIPLDHYIILDWVDFIDIINEVGGVDIDVPEYAYDPAYTICSFCGDVYPVEFVPGIEHMDGERALAYARIRKSDNDYKRIERQQLVLKALARKASSISTIIDNPIGLYNKYKDAVETDIGDFEMGGIALLAKQVGPDNIRTISMAPATYPCPAAVCGSAAELIWDPEKVEELKAQVFSDSRLSQENATVTVLNGTPIPGLAGEFQTIMAGHGIPSPNVTVDEYANGLLYDTTIVIDATGGHDHTVQQIANWLDLPDSQVVLGTDPQATPFLNATSDIIVVLGQDIEYTAAGDLTVTAPVSEG